MDSAQSATLQHMRLDIWNTPAHCCTLTAGMQSSSFQLLGLILPPGFSQTGDTGSDKGKDRTA